MSVTGMQPPTTFTFGRRCWMRMRLTPLLRQEIASIPTWRLGAKSLFIRREIARIRQSFSASFEAEIPSLSPCSRRKDLPDSVDLRRCRSSRRCWILCLLQLYLLSTFSNILVNIKGLSSKNHPTFDWASNLF